MTPTTSEPPRRGRPRTGPTVTRTRVETVPLPAGRAEPVGALAAVGAAYAVLLVGALVGRPWVFALGAAGALLSEVLLPRVRAVGWAFGQVQLGPLARCLVRGLLAVTLLARCSAGSGSLDAAALGWLAVAVLSAAAYGLAEVISVLGKSPVLSRGLDLGAVQPPAAPSRWLTDERTSAATDLTLLAGVTVVAAGGSGGLLAAGLTVSLLAELTLVAALLAAARRLRAAAPRRGLPAAIAEQVRQLAPEVVLFHSGEPVTAYQVESWLRVVEDLGRPALVLLRDTRTLESLAPSVLPVVCIPAATALAAFDLSSVRVALFCANGAGNIHLLRRPGIGFAFVGHGDSDKASSSTPFARVYDEVWVAGPAGRERYERAGSRLAPDAIVEVGRPQLAALQRLSAEPPIPDAPGVQTVLYAPTWEGWGDDDFHTSLPYVGPELVQRLIGSPGLRVVYRPHPLTGTRDAAVRAAHREVLARLRAAGAVTTEAGTSWAGAQHRIVPGRDPGLLDCFAHADLLLADVSAVLSDWLATGRPYAVLNPGDRPGPELREAAPSTAAGVLLDSRLTALDTLLGDLRAGTDPERAVRAELAAYLLGPTGDEAMERFRAAVESLARRAQRPDGAQEA
jgi:hypothetical protein